MLLHTLHYLLLVTCTHHINYNYSEENNGNDSDGNIEKVVTKNV